MDYSSELPIPADFLELRVAQVPALGEDLPRYVAVYPVNASQYAVCDGSIIRGSGEQDGSLVGWLHTYLENDTPDVLVLDTATRKAWRARFASAFIFLRTANERRDLRSV